jgi:predicted ABC-type sugar transport system permease subunit
MRGIYSQADAVQKLFGIGVGNLFNLAGIFAHNIVATFVLELGIGGSLLFAAYVWILSRKCPTSIYLLVLPMVINGFSLVSTTMPYFFVTLGLLAALRGTVRDGTSEPKNETTRREI